MMTLNVEDLTIKQIKELCKEQPDDTCVHCPIKSYCHTNFVGQPQFFTDYREDEDEDMVDVEINED